MNSNLSISGDQSICQSVSQSLTAHPKGQKIFGQWRKICGSADLLSHFRVADLRDLRDLKLVPITQIIFKSTKVDHHQHWYGLKCRIRQLETLSSDGVLRPPHSSSNRTCVRCRFSFRGRSYQCLGSPCCRSHFVRISWYFVSPGHSLLTDSLQKNHELNSDKQQARGTRGGVLRRKFCVILF